MALRKAQPYRHSPTTVSDALDGTDVTPGMMSALVNLIPDPTTRNLWVPRPAAQELTAFPGFATPGFVSLMEVVGNLVLGMVASTRFAGKDEPFCYNLVSGTFTTVSGVTSANVPTSPNPTGTWTPPTADVIGTKFTLTHPGYDGVTNFVGWIDISNPSAPSYSAGNVTGATGSALPSVPVAVAQFYQRAYYLCNPAGAQPAALATDVLDPTKRTNATYTLTFGDNVQLTALKGLALTNALLGGVVQSLMVFKGTAEIYQITGDFAPATTGGTDSSIAQSSLNVPTGTLAANAIVNTPLGMMFVSPDGVRMIDLNAHISDPLGEAGSGVVVPFATAVVPSRMSAGCNASVVRFSLQNGSALGNPQQEWWFDLTRKTWSGPHSFPMSLYATQNDTFIVTPQAVTGSLWQSDAMPNATSNYTENGVPMTWSYQTVLLPVREDMEECSMIETLLYLGFPFILGVVNVVLQDQNGASLGATTLQSTSAPSTWGSVVWGSGLWGGASSALAARRLNWAQPVVFDRLSLRASGPCGQGLRLGDCYFKYQRLGYLAQP